MIKEKVKIDILELCHDSYRNLWFLIKKKQVEKYRLINVALKMNKVIIRDANLFSSIDEFLKDFVECVISLLLNFFSRYDYMFLNIELRNITVFMTFIELYRMIILSQNAINSVAQFCRAIIIILKKHISNSTRQFMNDFEIMNFKT